MSQQEDIVETLTGWIQTGTAGERPTDAMVTAREEIVRLRAERDDLRLEVRDASITAEAECKRAEATEARAGRLEGILQGIAAETCTCGTTLHRPCEVCRARAALADALKVRTWTGWMQEPSRHADTPIIVRRTHAAEGAIRCTVTTTEEAADEA